MKKSEVLNKLKKLGSDARSKGLGLDIKVIIETVTGSEYDEDFGFFVRLGLEASGAIKLDEIVIGILKLKEWQKRLR